MTNSVPILKYCSSSLPKLTVGKTITNGVDVNHKNLIQQITKPQVYNRGYFT